MKIFCPQCGYKPTPDVMWYCRPGCHHAWHTFHTGGQCPSCFKQWRETACPACHAWSLHEHWYHDDLPVHEEEVERRAPALA